MQNNYNFHVASILQIDRLRVSRDNRFFRRREVFKNQRTILTLGFFGIIDAKISFQGDCDPRRLQVHPHVKRPAITLGDRDARCIPYFIFGGKSAQNRRLRPSLSLTRQWDDDTRRKRVSLVCIAHAARTYMHSRCTGCFSSPPAISFNGLFRVARPIYFFTQFSHKIIFITELLSTISVHKTGRKT